MPKVPDPTPQQLQLAVRQLWRPGWPGFPTDPQASIDHPTYGVCVRGQARTLSRAPLCTAPRRAYGLPNLLPASVPAATAPAAPTKPRRGYVPAGAFDARRAAANDRDDG